MVQCLLSIRSENIHKNLHFDGLIAFRQGHVPSQFPERCRKIGAHAVIHASVKLGVFSAAKRMIKCQRASSMTQKSLNYLPSQRELVVNGGH